MKRLITLILTLIMLYAIALADEPATTMIGAANVPSIPAGTLSASLVSFTSNQTYPVYSAPDSKSVRGAKDRARVSTNGWIQVFGSESDWILVQYDITDTHNRIGYIYKNALPADVTVPELNLTSIPSVVHYDVEVTDDPLVSRMPLARLTENSKVTCLGTMGEWTYIEAEADKERFRGFVPSACLYETVTELSEARQAMLGSWRLYAGSSINASRITFREDGSMTGRTQLESGREMEWSGTWSIDFYDVRRDRYLNESEFELTRSSTVCASAVRSRRMARTSIRW